MSQRTYEAAIHALLVARAAAIQAKDPDRALACLAPDVVSFTLAPPLATRGAAARDRDSLAAWFATWRGPIDYEMRDIEIAVCAELGLAHGFVRIGGTKQDGHVNALWARLTVGLSRREGTWIIIHEHISTPFYMDGSLKAAVDLQP